MPRSTRKSCVGSSTSSGVLVFFLIFVAGDPAVTILGPQARAEQIAIPDPGEAAPEVVRRLVAAEIDVFEVRHERRSLEEYFLELTEGPADA